MTNPDHTETKQTTGMRSAFGITYRFRYKALFEAGHKVPRMCLLNLLKVRD